MTLDTFTIKSKVAVTLTPDSATSVVLLYDPSPYVKAGYRVISEYAELNNVKAVSWIYSQPEIPFPVFELEDTESKQLLTAINLEWKSPRIQMNVVLTVDDGITYQRLGAYSLLNSAPYPYREYTLGDHTLGDNAKLGVQITSAGYGLLNTANGGSDRVTVYADLTRVITLERITDTSTKIANTITSTASIIAPSNEARRALSFVNTTTTTVFIDTVSGITTESYLVELEPGDYWEPPDQSYTGNYYGIVASGTVGIDIREFV